MHVVIFLSILIVFLPDFHLAIRIALSVRKKNLQSGVRKKSRKLLLRFTFLDLSLIVIDTLSTLLNGPPYLHHCVVRSTFNGLSDHWNESVKILSNLCSITFVCPLMQAFIFGVHPWMNFLLIQINIGGKWYTVVLCSKNSPRKSLCCVSSFSYLLVN